MNSHTQRQWEGKFFRCGMRCHYCHKPLSLRAENPDHEATKDHLTPVSRGGGNTIDNIVPACWTCNRRKGDMTEQEFLTAFSKAFEILRRVPSQDGLVLSLEKRDERPLWKLREENEGMSWAWRHPA